MCAYYKAFSVIYPGAELGPIFSAWVLLRHNNTTATSQQDLRSATTMQARKKEQ